MPAHETASRGEASPAQKSGNPRFSNSVSYSLYKSLHKTFQNKKIYAQSRPNKNKNDFQLDINGAPWYNNFSGLAGFGSTRRPWNF